MKHTKKLVCLVLALLMVFAMATTAFADSTATHTITITHDGADHTYVAYQVFQGDLETLGDNTVLTNIEWGTGVNGTALLTALKEKNTAYKDCKTASDVAAVLKGFANNSAVLDEFATLVGENLTATSAGESTKSSDNTYTIEVTGDGYYFVKDKNAVTGDDAATKYILEVCKNVSVNAKAETPEIDKVIVNADSENGKGTAQDVGSAVSFKLTSKVPAMDGYSTYTFIVHDTLSAGLTFNNDVAVTIGGTPLTEGTDYTVAAEGQTFTVTIANLKGYAKDAEIVITYSATINEKALTTDKETNTVKLEYSNDPYNTNSKGETPEKIVYVYDFDVVINKTDENSNKLAGAKFVLKNTDGKYYKWNATDKKAEWVTVENATALTDAAGWETAGVTVVTTDENGAAKFQGVDTGDYYLKEVEAPAGYNFLKDEIKVEITATYGADGQIATTSAKKDTDHGQYYVSTDIVNKSGAQLPSTGGMGTTLFYVIGGVLVLAAVVLLVTKKRMSAKG